MGRPREVKGGGCQMTFYMDSSRVNDFRKLCEEHGISVSDGLRQLMEQELEKNEIGLVNPTNIQYGLRNKSLDGNNVNLTLDRFIDTKEAKELTEQIPIEQLSIAFANSKKLNQQIQYRQTGKITL